MLLPVERSHSSLPAQVSDVGWLAISQKGAIGRHEEPTLAKSVITVLGEELRKALGVEHGVRIDRLLTPDQKRLLFVSQSVHAIQIEIHEFRVYPKAKGHV